MFIVTGGVQGTACGGVLIQGLFTVTILTSLILRGGMYCNPPLIV